MNSRTRIIATSLLIFAVLLYALFLIWKWGVTRNYVTSNIRKVLFSNISGYSNPEVDRLADAAAGEVADAKRQTHYSQMQKVMAEDCPTIWLVELEFPTLSDKRVKNLVTTGIGIHESFDNVHFQR